MADDRSPFEDLVAKARRRLSAPHLNISGKLSGRAWKEILHPRDHLGRFKDKPDFDAAPANHRMPSNPAHRGDPGDPGGAIWQRGLTNFFRGGGGLGSDRKVGAWAPAPGQSPRRGGTFLLDVWDDKGNYVGRVRMKGKKQSNGGTEWQAGAIVRPGRKADAGAVRDRIADLERKRANIEAQAQTGGALSGVPVSGVLREIDEQLAEARQALAGRAVEQQPARAVASERASAIAPGNPPIPGLKVKHGRLPKLLDQPMRWHAKDEDRLRYKGRPLKLPAGYQVVGTFQRPKEHHGRFIYIAGPNGEDLHRLHVIPDSDGNLNIRLDAGPARGAYEARQRAAGITPSGVPALPGRRGAGRDKEPPSGSAPKAPAGASMPTEAPFGGWDQYRAMVGQMSAEKVEEERKRLNAIHAKGGLNEGQQKALQRMTTIVAAAMERHKGRQPGERKLPQEHSVVRPGSERAGAAPKGMRRVNADLDLPLNRLEAHLRDPLIAVGVRPNERVRMVMAGRDEDGPAVMVRTEVGGQHYWIQNGRATPHAAPHLTGAAMLGREVADVLREMRQRRGTPAREQALMDSEERAGNRRGAPSVGRQATHPGRRLAELQAMDIDQLRREMKRLNEIIQRDPDSTAAKHARDRRVMLRSVMAEKREALRNEQARSRRSAAPRGQITPDSRGDTGSAARRRPGGTDRGAAWAAIYDQIEPLSAGRIPGGSPDHLRRQRALLEQLADHPDAPADKKEWARRRIQGINGRIGGGVPEGMPAHREFNRVDQPAYEVAHGNEAVKAYVRDHFPDGRRLQPRLRAKGLGIDGQWTKIDVVDADDKVLGHIVLQDGQPRTWSHQPAVPDGPMRLSPAGSVQYPGRAQVAGFEDPASENFETPADEGQGTVPSLPKIQGDRWHGVRNEQARKVLAADLGLTRFDIEGQRPAFPVAQEHHPGDPNRARKSVWKVMDKAGPRYFEYDPAGHPEGWREVRAVEMGGLKKPFDYLHNPSASPEGGGLASMLANPPGERIQVPSVPSLRPDAPDEEPGVGARVAFDQQFPNAKVMGDRGFKDNLRDQPRKMEQFTRDMGLPEGWKVVGVGRVREGSGQQAQRYNVFIEGPENAKRMIEKVPIRREGRRAHLAPAASAPANIPGHNGAVLRIGDWVEHFQGDTNPVKIVMVDTDPAYMRVQRVDGSIGRVHASNFQRVAADRADRAEAALGNADPRGRTDGDLRAMNNRELGMLRGQAMDFARVGDAGQKQRAAELIPRIDAEERRRAAIGPRPVTGAPPAGQTGVALTGPPPVPGRKLAKVPADAKGKFPEPFNAGNPPQLFVQGREFELPPGYKVAGWKRKAGGYGHQFYITDAQGKDVHLLQARQTAGGFRVRLTPAAYEVYRERLRAQQIRRRERRHARGEAGERTIRQLERERVAAEEAAQRERVKNIIRQAAQDAFPGAARIEDVGRAAGQQRARNVKVVDREGRKWNIVVDETGQVLRRDEDVSPRSDVVAPDDHILNPKPFGPAELPSWLTTGAITKIKKRKSDSVNATFFAEAPEGHGVLLKPEKGQYEGGLVAQIENEDGLEREMAAQVIARALGVRMPRTTVRNDADFPAYTTYEGRSVAAGPDRALVVERLANVEVVMAADQRRLDTVQREDWLRVAMMDVIIGNLDRHKGNVMIDGDGRLWAIDHGLAFPTHHNTYRGNTRIQDEQAGRTIPPEMIQTLHEMEARWDDIREKMLAEGLKPVAADMALKRLRFMILKGQIPASFEMKNADNY